jgi:hypothetical protein
MRKIEFKPSVSGMTKIFVDNTELSTALDLKAFRQYRIMKSKLPPVMGQNIFNAVVKKLADDVISLSKDETDFILKFVKEELNL